MKKFTGRDAYFKLGVIEGFKTAIVQQYKNFIFPFLKIILKLEHFFLNFADLMFQNNFRMRIEIEANDFKVRNQLKFSYFCIIGI